MARRAMDRKNEANQEERRGVSLGIIEPLNQLQHSPTPDLLVMGKNKLLVGLSHQNPAFCSMERYTILTDRKRSRLFSLAPIFREDANIVNAFMEK